MTRPWPPASPSSTTPAAPPRAPRWRSRRRVFNAPGWPANRTRPARPPSACWPACVAARPRTWRPSSRRPTGRGARPRIRRPGRSARGGRPRHRRAAPLGSGGAGRRGAVEAVNTSFSGHQAGGRSELTELGLWDATVVVTRSPSQLRGFLGGTLYREGTVPPTVLRDGLPFSAAAIVAQTTASNVNGHVVRGVILVEVVSHAKARAESP